MLMVKDVPIGKIKSGENAQRLGESDEELQELVESIRRIGIIVPLLVAPEGDLFVVIAGHRRLAAARKCSLAIIPCSVREDSGVAQLEMTFAENLFRRDLTPLEFASAIKDCIDNKVMPAEELATALHRSTEWIRRMVAMLDWPTDVLEAIHAGWLSVAAAHNVALIEDDTYRGFLLRNAQDSGATARVTAAWLQAWRSMAPADQAILAKPVSGESQATPMVPQAPCLACGEVYRTDELSHVPICAGCIRAIRNAGR